MSSIKESSSFVADPRLISELECCAKPASPGPDGVLFRQGDAPRGVFIVREGQVTLAMQTATETAMNTRVGPGSVLGLPAVIGGQPYSLTAVAESGAVLSFAPKEDFVALMGSKPAMSFHILQLLAQEIRAARAVVSELVDAAQ